MLDNEKAARHKRICRAIMWVTLLALFLCFIFPFVLVIINVFKTKADITSDPLALIGAHGFTLKNFPEAMKKMNFSRVFLNSAIITTSATVLTILVSSMTAFVMVRNPRWRICSLTFSLMIASMVIPFQVLMVPLGIRLRRHPGCSQPPADSDPAPRWFLRVHGHVHVPRCH